MPSSNNTLQLLNIHKSFGGVVALDDVTLHARTGEIHAVVGENGAGKSTLMKILAGAYQKDSGRIIIDGSDVQIKNPNDGKKAGVGIIYQELSLVQALSVAENIFLHHLKEKKVWMNWTELNRQADALIGSLGFDISPGTRVCKLSMAQQQVVEIAKALSENVQILILDEPTSVLAPNETLKLFDLLRRLRENGVTILYISHRLQEILSISDTITVLKDGQVTGSVKTSEVQEGEVIELMIGRKLESMFPRRTVKPGSEIFRVENLGAGSNIRNISFSVRQGEILGIAGLVGAGRTETIRAIFSADKRERGKIYMDGKEKAIRSTVEAVRAGIGFIPEDRKTQGVILSMSVMNNLSMTNLKEISDISGRIKARKELKKANDLVKKMGIKTENTRTEVNHLSGGNQQKVSLAKWIGLNCKVIFMDEPTRGIDVGSRADIYGLINDLSEKGTGIVIVSSEMMEVVGLCDRIIVMHDGRISGEINREEFSEEKILRLSIGNNSSS